jgi:hypothetical protein
MTTCSIPTCGEPAHARGLCNRHYVHQRCSGVPESTFPIICQVPGCGIKVLGLGLCQMHYTRRRRYIQWCISS